jgi:gliding motility-associated-like protein
VDSNAQFCYKVKINIVMSLTRIILKALTTGILALGVNTAQAQLTVSPHDTTVCGSLLTLTATLQSAQVTQVQGLGDDSYSAAIPIGFTFNFYGTPYTQVLVGSNGILNFNLTNALSYCTWPINAAIPTAPANVYNSIMLPWMDIYPGIGGIVNYTTVGTAPNRKFIATWCGIPYFSCTSNLLTSQAILYETSNNIEIHMGVKNQYCSWNGNYAIEGVINANGTIADAVPGRNFPAQWAAYHSSHLFVYNGTNYNISAIPYAPIPVNTNTITWYQGPPVNGVVLGTGNTLQVNPTVPTTYYAMVVSCADTVFDTCRVNIGVGDSIDYTTFLEPSFCGYTDGSIQLHGLTPNDTFIINYQVNGNQQPPFQAIIPFDSTVNIPNLGSGTYVVYAVNNGCATPPMTVILTDPPFDLDSVTAVGPTICGANDGYIKFWGADVPNTGYIVNYDKDGVPQPPVNLTSDAIKHVTLPNLGPGIYSNIVFENMFNCQTVAYGPFTFVEPPFSVDFDTATNLGCAGDTLQLYDLSVGVTQYAWDFGDGGTSTDANPMHIYQQQGTFTVTLVGTNGFCTDTKSVTVPLIHPLDAEFTVTKDSICNGETIIFTNNSIGLPGQFRYEWNFGDGSEVDTAYSTSHTYTTDGIFNATLTLVDFVPCTSVETREIVVASLAIAIGPKDTSVCLSDPMLLYTETTAPPYFSGGITYSWTPTDNLESPNSAETNFFTEVPGTYQYVLNAVGYPMGCTATDTLNIFVQPKPVLINVTPDQVIKYGSSIQLHAEGVTYYLWTPPATLDNPDIPSPVGTPTEPTVYTVIGMNEHGGCRDTANVVVDIDYTMDEFVPSAFSPNGDGKNDVFRLTRIQYQKIVEFRVFNRWGKEVYNNTNPNGGWDGTFNGTPQDPGVYSYLIRITVPDGDARTYKGNVTLVR